MSMLLLLVVPCIRKGLGPGNKHDPLMNCADPLLIAIDSGKQTRQTTADKIDPGKETLLFLDESKKLAFSIQCRGA